MKTVPPGLESIEIVPKGVTSALRVSLWAGDSVWLASKMRMVRGENSDVPKISTRWATPSETTRFWMGAGPNLSPSMTTIVRDATDAGTTWTVNRPGPLGATGRASTPTRNPNVSGNMGNPRHVRDAVSQHEAVDPVGQGLDRLDAKRFVILRHSTSVPPRLGPRSPS